jgi:hypothetical protein
MHFKEKSKINSVLTSANINSARAAKSFRLGAKGKKSGDDEPVARTVILFLALTDCSDHRYCRPSGQHVSPGLDQFFDEYQGDAE